MKSIELAQSGATGLNTRIELLSGATKLVNLKCWNSVVTLEQAVMMKSHKSPSKHLSKVEKTGEQNAPQEMFAAMQLAYKYRVANPNLLLQLLSSSVMIFLRASLKNIFCSQKPVSNRNQ